MIVLFRTRLRKILIWQRFSGKWESDFRWIDHVVRSIKVGTIFKLEGANCKKKETPQSHSSTVYQSISPKFWLKFHLHPWSRALQLDFKARVLFLKVIVATMCLYRCRMQKQFTVIMVGNNINTDRWQFSRVKTTKPIQTLLNVN